jgi:hypothetical protein
MKTTATIARTIAATLLTLASACGSGQPVQGEKQQFRRQNPAELNSENGLLAVSLTDSCLSLETFSIDPLGDGIIYTPPDTSSCSDPMNGMAPNLLGLNGLSPGGLSTDSFDKWFAADPAAANALMKYLVKCSMPYASSLDYTADDGSRYSWSGLFGLAPEWVAGAPIPEKEQQLVSACVAAHANKYGAHVPISVLGNQADGSPIPVDDQELATYPLPEGCFFGNLFSSDGVFSGDARVIQLGEEDSSLRACALPDRSGAGGSSNCVPMQYVGRCDDVCQRDPSGLYYTACTANGKTFAPVSTRIQPSVNYTCGDGVCQVTEKCGNGTTWDNCGLDCGPCN